MIFSDKQVLTSFGLISPGKGYEKVIESLPEVVEKFPNLLYLILGQTHPVVRKEEGEKYRNFLENKVKELNLQANVKFYNKYMTLQEIIKYLEATDIYISSSTNPNQITSGTLAYAMGCGRAVISTPFLHAKDLLPNKERGLLAEFDNPKSFSETIFEILSNENLKKTMEINAYTYSRHMTWPNVALSYLNLFKKHLEISNEFKLPEIKMDHLHTLTDDFGMIQFANHAEPDTNSGYTLDDNARAMIACSMHYNKDPTLLKRINSYLNFICYIQHEDGRFFNYVDYARSICKKYYVYLRHGFRSLYAPRLGS